ncbi:hypothetical protein JTM39_32890, partial [Pseudomonas aeruginosa]|nr:hypothetical protein [Pseudomonas aeruginosa]
RLKPWAWPIWMVARSSTLSSVYDIGAAPYRKGQVLHSVFAAADPNDFKSVTAMLQFFLRYEYPPPADNVGTCPKCIGSPG